MKGEKFGRLLVLDCVGKNKHRSLLWLCKCDCGNAKVVNGALLRSGRTKSCGCLNKEVISKNKRKHGFTGTKFYGVWNSMVMRCHNENSTSYRMYGGRGIKVCRRWRNFDNFKSDMYKAYKEGLSLERINNNLGYNPENCKWATPKEQANNTRRNTLLNYRGEVSTMSEMARKHNIGVNVFKRRLYSGWSVERAIEEPINNRG